MHAISTILCWYVCMPLWCHINEMTPNCLWHCVTFQHPLLACKLDRMAEAFAGDGENLSWMHIDPRGGGKWKERVLFLNRPESFWTVPGHWKQQRWKISEGKAVATGKRRNAGTFYCVQSHDNPVCVTDLVDGTDKWETWAGARSFISSNTITYAACKWNLQKNGSISYIAKI